MLGRWREEFNAGRASVRNAATGAQAAPIDHSSPRQATAAPDKADEIKELRSLLGEVSQIAELSQARIAELDTALAVALMRADSFAEVLRLPGVRRTLLKAVAVDTHPDADEEQRRTLTEWSKKVNAAYELLEPKANPDAVQ